MRTACAVSAALMTLATLASTAQATTRYPAGARHSPMTAEVVAHLRTILDRGVQRGARTDVFVKIGDSITAYGGFLNCFAFPEQVNLAGHTELAETLSFFSQTHADSRSLPWNRKSSAAARGWSTLGAIGTPQRSPLRQEIVLVRPAFAIVMLGTNETYGGGVRTYERNLRRVVDDVVSEGVIPIVSTIPPRRDSRDLDAIVVQMNRVVLQIAEAAQVPLVDYGGELRKLPRYGLSFDGIHPAPAGDQACALDDESLTGGVNLRNLVTLEALDRVRRFLVANEPPEPEP